MGPFVDLGTLRELPDIQQSVLFFVSYPLLGTSQLRDGKLLHAFKFLHVWQLPWPLHSLWIHITVILLIPRGLFAWWYRDLGRVTLSSIMALSKALRPGKATLSSRWNVSEDIVWFYLVLRSPRWPCHISGMLFPWLNAYGQQSMVGHWYRVYETFCFQDGPVGGHSPVLLLVYRMKPRVEVLA